MDLGKEFTTEKLSSAITGVSLEILGWPLQVSSWRHINIAFKRKHCTRSMSILAGEDSNPIHALQSGHSVATENRIYGVTAESLLGAPEDIVHAYLDASTEWQRLFKVVPGGLSDLTYLQSQMHHYDQLNARGLFVSKVFKKPQVTPPVANAPNDTAAILDAIAQLQYTSNESQKVLLTEVQQLRDRVSSLESEVTKFTRCMFI